MKNIVLSKKDTDLIERAVIAHGRILTSGNLQAVFESNYTTASARNRINQLSRSGWLKRIKRGKYLITDSILTRSQSDVSPLIIANSLIERSYVSFSRALNYYQMYDQFEKVITSITTQKRASYNFDTHTYIFSKVKESMYFGFAVKRENGKMVRIAEAEKALIDLLYLNQEFSGASIVFETIKKYHHRLDLIKLQEYAIKSNPTVLRKIGFLLDAAELESEKAFCALEKNSNNYSRFTAGSKIFNSKWRIYYDDRIIR